jgi:hypothetical protein
MPADPAGQGELFPDPPAVRRLRRAADDTLRALRRSGRLEPCDTLLMALVRTTADVADQRRNDPDAAWHLNAALKLLADLDGRLRQIGGPEHDAFAELLAAASGPAPPGHPA